MALRVVSLENVTRDAEMEDHSTLYATRVEGDYYILEDTKYSDAFTSDGWQIQGSTLTVYPSEIDGYIELFTKLKAQH